MTIRVLCDGDGCDQIIDRDVGGWFGVDYQAPPVVVAPDATVNDDAVWTTGMIEYTELVQLGQDHEFHFHSVDCLVSWAMTRAFTPQPEGTSPHES